MELIGSTFGPYVLLEQLGKGGSGVVYRARHQPLDRTCALKFLTPGACEADRQRFRREMRLAARADHPGLIQLYDAGTLDDTDYIAMELAEGGNLADLVRRQGPLPLVGVIPAAAAIAGALAWLHQHEIVHRDLKPANVLICARGALKVSDFGLARELDSTRYTAAGAFMGTLPFAAPELLTGGVASRASDMWALGCTFYNLLLGKSPFRSAGDSVAQWLDAILNAFIEPPAAASRVIPDALSELVMALLERDPAKRPSAEVVEARLEQLRSSLPARVPVPAVRPLKSDAEPVTRALRTRPDRPRRPAWRWVAAAIGLVALFLVVRRSPAPAIRATPSPTGEVSADRPARTRALITRLVARAQLVELELPHLDLPVREGLLDTWRLENQADRIELEHLRHAARSGSDKLMLAREALLDVALVFERSRIERDEREVRDGPGKKQAETASSSPNDQGALALWFATLEDQAIREGRFETLPADLYLLQVLKFYSGVDVGARLRLREDELRSAAGQATAVARRRAFIGQIAVALVPPVGVPTIANLEQFLTWVKDSDPVPGTARCVEAVAVHLVDDCLHRAFRRIYRGGADVLRVGVVPGYMHVDLAHFDDSISGMDRAIEAYIRLVERIRRLLDDPKFPAPRSARQALHHAIDPALDLMQLDYYRHRAYLQSVVAAYGDVWATPPKISGVDTKVTDRVTSSCIEHLLAYLENVPIATDAYFTFSIPQFLRCLFQLGHLEQGEHNLVPRNIVPHATFTSLAGPLDDLVKGSKNAPYYDTAALLQTTWQIARGALSDGVDLVRFQHALHVLELLVSVRTPTRLDLDSIQFSLYHTYLDQNWTMWPVLKGRSVAGPVNRKEDFLEDLSRVISSMWPQSARPDWVEDLLERITLLRFVRECEAAGHPTAPIGGILDRLCRRLDHYANHPWLLGHRIGYLLADLQIASERLARVLPVALPFPEAIDRLPGAVGKELAKVARDQWAKGWEPNARAPSLRDLQRRRTVLIDQFFGKSEPHLKLRDR